jgi:FtsH-binding integral membrane protein
MFTGLAFGGALSTAYFAAKSGLMTVSPIISMIFMFAGLIGASVMKPLPANETYNGHTIYKTQNSPLRLGLYGMGVAGLGLSASPLLAYAYMVSPNIIINALAAATGIFGGASYVAYSMPKDKMLGYGRILGGSLMGLIGIQLAGLLSTLVIGPNAFASLLFSVDSYFSIALFTGFVAYDTHVAIKSY